MSSSFVDLSFFGILVIYFTHVFHRMLIHSDAEVRLALRLHDVHTLMEVAMRWGMIRARIADHVVFCSEVTCQ